MPSTSIRDIIPNWTGPTRFSSIRGQRRLDLFIRMAIVNIDRIRVGGCKHTRGTRKGHCAVGTASIMNDPGFKYTNKSSIMQGQGLLILLYQCLIDCLDPSLVTWRPPLSLRPAIIKPDRILILQLRYGRCLPPPTTVQQGKSNALFECDCATAIRFLDTSRSRENFLSSSINNGRHAQRRGPFRFPPLY